MRYRILFTLFGTALAAHSQPNCTGIGLEVDARCACVKDPTSDTCKLQKTGLYDGKLKWAEVKPVSPPATPASRPVSAPAPVSRPAPAAAPRTQQARMVPLAHKDYLRFLQPDSQLAVGFDLGKATQSPELMASLFGQDQGEDGRNKVLAALKEIDHLWLSVAGPGDVVFLMTGRFDQGVTAGMFYSKGVQPVFLGGAKAMMIGPEPSLQAALDRLAKPAAEGGWVTRRARELSRDHETWIATEPPAGTSQPGAALAAIRQFSMGVRLVSPSAIDGEMVADSDASADKIAAWVEAMKAAIRKKTGAGALDALTVEHTGASLRFAAKDDALLAGDAGKSALNSDLGVELYSVMMAGFPGVPKRTVAEDKLRAVQAGMLRADVLALLGQPLSVSAIQGLDTPRETWIYQIPFGKQLSLRLDDGVVTSPAH